MLTIQFQLDKETYIKIKTIMIQKNITWKQVITEYIKQQDSKKS